MEKINLYKTIFYPRTLKLRLVAIQEKSVNHVCK